MDYTKIIEKVKPSIALVFVIKNGKIVSKGSGFVYSSKGILVTCNHVISFPDSGVTIKFPNSEDLIDARVAIRDEEHDLALLKFEKSSINPLRQADIKVVKEGMPVFFSGYPLSLTALTTHQGILSAIIKDATGSETYLIDGTVNAGNSGCPLMTETGEVIGVVNAKRREHSDLLSKVEELSTGAVSLHGIDLVEVYQAIISNVQLGIGYAVPSSYIPEHVEPSKSRVTTAQAFEKSSPVLQQTLKVRKKHE
ncbi:MAG: serine protease [Candidatus Gottesmanbacteria bacterium]|nr:serine protease [Candidatus Gottesmanbacteria bacterium]